MKKSRKTKEKNEPEWNMKGFILDGNNFHNLDAFNDLLRGGFGVHPLISNFLLTVSL